MSDSLGLDLATPDIPIPVVPPDKVRAAALTVCRCARDTADAALLLAALGLTAGDHLATLRTISPLPNPKRIKGMGR